MRNLKYINGTKTKKSYLVVLEMYDRLFGIKPIIEIGCNKTIIGFRLRMCHKSNDLASVLLIAGQDYKLYLPHITFSKTTMSYASLPVGVTLPIGYCAAKDILTALYRDAIVDKLLTALLKLLNPRKVVNKDIIYAFLLKKFVNSIEFAVDRKASMIIKTHGNVVNFYEWKKKFILQKGK